MKGILYITMLLCFLSISCSNTNDVNENYSSPETLREELLQKSGEVKWTNDIDGENAIDVSGLASFESAEELNRRLFSQDGSNTVLFFYNYQTDTKIYPSIQGFGSLDTSVLPDDVILLANNFLSSLQEKNIETEYFLPALAFQKVLVEYELYSLPQITSWLLGESKPVQNVQTQMLSFEIPIRLIFEQGYSHCVLYCVEYEDSFKIQQFNFGVFVDE